MAAISPNAMGARGSSGPVGAAKKKLGLRSAVPMKSAPLQKLEATSSAPKPGGVKARLAALEAASNAGSPTASPAKDEEVSAAEDADLAGYLAPTYSAPPTESLTVRLPALQPQQQQLPDASEILPTDLSRISFGGMIKNMKSELSVGAKGRGTIELPGPAATQTDAEAIEAQLGAANARADALAGREIELESTVACLEQQIDETVAHMEQQHQSEIEELTLSWSTEKEALTSQVDLGCQGLELSAQEIEQLQEKNTQLHANTFSQKIVQSAVVKALQGKLDALKEDLASAGGEQNARASELNQQLQEMDASHMAALADLKVTQQDELEATVDEMEEELVMAEGELGDTVAELEAQHQEEIEALEALLAEARSAAQAVAVAPAAQEAGTMLGKEALGLMGEFETIETVLAQGVELELKHSEMAAAISEKDAEVVELQTTVGELKTQLGETVQMLEATHVECAEAKKIGASAMVRGAELESALGSANGLMDDMELKMSETVAELEASHTQHMAGAVKELEDVQQKLGEAEKAVGVLTSKAADLEEAQAQANGSLEKAETYTAEQRERCDVLMEQSNGLRQEITLAQGEKEVALRKATELQNDLSMHQKEVSSGMEKMASLQKVIDGMADEAKEQEANVEDGGAAMERCEELEEKLEMLNLELTRSQTQLKRSSAKSSESEKKLAEGTRTLKSTQKALAAVEERASIGEMAARSEKSAREVAVREQGEAESRRSQAEFEQQLAEGEKSQMMMKLDMLLVSPAPTTKSTRRNRFSGLFLTDLNRDGLAAADDTRRAYGGDQSRAHTNGARGGDPEA